MLLFTIIVVLPMLITLAGVALVLMWLDRILTVLCDMAEEQDDMHKDVNRILYLNSLRMNI